MVRARVREAPGRRKYKHGKQNGEVCFSKDPHKPFIFPSSDRTSTPCVLTRSNSPRLIATYKRKRRVSLWTEYCSLFHPYWRKAGLYISETVYSLIFLFTGASRRLEPVIKCCSFLSFFQCLVSRAPLSAVTESLS